MNRLKPVIVLGIIFAVVLALPTLGRGGRRHHGHGHHGHRGHFGFSLGGHRGFGHHGFHGHRYHRHRGFSLGFGLGYYGGYYGGYRSPFGYGYPYYSYYSYPRYRYYNYPMRSYYRSPVYSVPLCSYRVIHAQPAEVEREVLPNEATQPEEAPGVPIPDPPPEPADPGEADGETKQITTFVSHQSSYQRPLFSDDQTPWIVDDEQ